VRILLVNDFSVPLGGAEQYFFDLASALSKFGAEVHTVSSDRIVRDEQFRAESLLGHTGHFKNLDSLFHPGNFAGFRRIQREFKPDVIHLNNIGYALSSSVAFACQHPTVLTLHDYFGLCVRDRRDCSGAICKCSLLNSGCSTGCGKFSIFKPEHLKRYLFRTALNRLSAIISPCEYLKRDYESSGYNNLIHIPHPYPPVNERSKPKEKMLLYVGRLEEQKGVGDLLPSFKRFRHSGGDLSLTIVGRGSEWANLERQRAELGLLDSVELLPWVAREQLRDYYERAIALVLPSKWPEVAPLVMFEALCAETPVIAAEVGGVPEVIITGKNGILFPPGDQAALASAFMRISKESDNLSRGARESAETGITSVTHTQALLDLYRRIGADNG
jgi:glycosyltransferase involved in cell wall biosynthesis